MLACQSQSHTNSFEKLNYFNLSVKREAFFFFFLMNGMKHNEASIISAHRKKTANAFGENTP